MWSSRLTAVPQKPDNLCSGPFSNPLCGIEILWEFPTAPKQRVFPKILLPAEHDQADSSYVDQKIRLLASEVLVGFDLTDDLVGFSRFHGFSDCRSYDLLQSSFGFLHEVATFRCFLNRRRGRMVV